MTYSIRLHAKVADDFAAMPLATQTRIQGAIRALADNPRPPGVKKLSDIKPGVKNAYRIRVGAYRVGYQIFDDELLVSIVAAAGRGEIYPLLKRRLKR